MKTVHLVALMSLVLLFSGNSAQAGPEVGNGGGTWVCRDQSGKIQWAQLVDLWEAVHQYGYQIPDDPASTVAEKIRQMKGKLEKVSPGYYLQIKGNLDYIIQNIRIDRTGGSELLIVPDANVLMKPNPGSCPNGTVRYEQLANYSPDGLILVNGEIWKRLKLASKAALYFHEAVYKWKREHEGEKTSDGTRRIVGLLFSDADPAAYFWRLTVHFAEFGLLCGQSGTIRERIRSCNVTSYDGRQLVNHAPGRYSVWYLGGRLWTSDLMSNEGGYEHAQRYSYSQAEKVCADSFLPGYVTGGFSDVGWHVPAVEDFDAYDSYPGTRSESDAAGLYYWTSTRDGRLCQSKYYAGGLVPKRAQCMVLIDYPYPYHEGAVVFRMSEDRSHSKFRSVKNVVRCVSEPLPLDFKSPR